MATIRSQLSLNDGMSKVLNQIVNALDLTLNAFERVQRASGQAFDSDDITQARQALLGANSAAQELADSYAQTAQQTDDVDDMADAYGRAAEQEEKLNQGISTGSSLTDNLLNKVRNIVTAIGAAKGISEIVELSDTLTSTNARLSLIVDDGGSVEELEAKIMASAQNSRAAYLDTADAVASLSSNAGAAFSSNDEVISFLEQVNKQFVIGGASAEGQSAAMLQLTQAMAAGALRGEELNSILENAPGIARAIESYMGIAEGSIKSYAEEGKVTADVVKNALFAAADETNAKFESMPMTWAQIWTSMQNKALSVFSPILEKINEVMNSEQFTTVIDGLINGLAGIAGIATMAFEWLINIGSAVQSWSGWTPIINGAQTAILAVIGALQTLWNIAGTVADFIIQNWSWIQPVIMGVAAAILIYKTYTLLAAAAQTVLNTVMAICSTMNPALLAIIGLVALISIITAVIRATNTFGSQSVSVFATVCGAINVVIQWFKNLGLSVANIALGIWNAMVACATNLSAAFHNAITGVQSWFYSLLSTALTVISGICEALNQLPFVEFDYSGITGAAADYAAKAAEAAADKQDYVSVADAFSEGYSTYDTWQEGWAQDAFDSGADWADGVQEKLSGLVDDLTNWEGSEDLFNFDDWDSLGAGTDTGTDLGTSYALDDIGDNTGSTADSAGSIADSLDTTTEELEYLRDIAERDAINRFTTAEVKIDMTGMTNQIEGSADLDGVLSTLTDGFAAALVTAAEGVHA